MPQSSMWTMASGSGLAHGRWTAPPLMSEAVASNELVIRPCSVVLIVPCAILAVHVCFCLWYSRRLNCGVCCVGDQGHCQGRAERQGP